MKNDGLFKKDLVFLEIIKILHSLDIFESYKFEFGEITILIKDWSHTDLQNSLDL